jgi:prolipoprotein diacylglyceryl transferase
MNSLAFIPSPAHNGFYVGPLYFHFYGIMYVIAVGSAIWITRRRWARVGGDPDLVYEVAKWGFPGGLVGGRIYFLITTPSRIPPHWWGPFAIWDGGLGIWGGIAGGVGAGLWVLYRRLPKDRVAAFMNAATPSLLVAQSIGRVGNYFNQELFGKPTTLPWALKIAPQFRPPGFTQFATFQPTFLYEIIWNLALAAVLVWLDNRRKVRAPGLFALYVAGYSAFRIFEETLRIDYSVHILGLRLNFFVALVGTIAGLLWFVKVQYGRGSEAPPAPPMGGSSRPAKRSAKPAAQSQHRSAPPRSPKGGGRRS